MRIHILGICGTFMGGIAALARAAGHQVSGSDANVYPPMSTQLASLGIPLLEGWSAEHLKPAPDLVSVGNALSRGNPELEAALARGLAYTSGPQWLAETAAQAARARRGRHPRQDHHLRHAGVDSGACRSESGLSHRRAAARLQGFGARGRREILCGGSRRVRHRVLRQGLQVSALPAANLGAQQPRVRPRRHFPGPREYPDAVSLSGAHRAPATA